MRLGNCLIGVLILAHRHPGGRLVVIRHPERWVPHLAWRAPDGREYHYRLRRDVLPWPLCYVLFAGTFARHRSATDGPTSGA